MNVPIRYIYCVWLWIVSLLYLLNLIPYSPLLSLIIALFFTLILNIFILKGKRVSKRLGIVIFEFIVLILVAYKSLQIDILFNILLFLTYNLYLLLNDLTFYKVYFVLMPKDKKNKESIGKFFNDKKNYILKDILKF